MSRYDYVQYDDNAKADQAFFKSHFDVISLTVDAKLVSPRAKALVHTKLEEAYMWVGKAIRDDQITRNGSAPLQEGRGHE